MDFKQIQELIKAVNKSNIGTLKVKEGDFEIVIKQKSDDNGNVVTYQMPQQFAPQSMPAPMPQPALEQKSSESTPVAPQETSNANTITIKSPMIGTFYRSPGPDKPSFVNVGDDVSVGKTVCIIETMKLFNEIESEISGKIVKVLVDDATPVEYDQPLFLVEP